MRNVIRTACVLAMFGITPALANESISAFIPDAKPVGQGRMTYLMWDVYDATLYAPGGHFQQDQPLALKLTYLRNLDGTKIADRSAEEMRKQGFKDELRLATWHGQMKKIFPDVSEGISLTGVLAQQGETVFFKDGQEIGRIKDPDFGKAFFDIWLAPQTSAPELRKKLLGES